jgi:hypothetical protein
MATTVTKIIDPDNGSGTDYTSLSAWEAAQQGDLTGVRDEIAVAKCRCTGGTADTTPHTYIDGWTTDSTRYIKIWTDPSESYRHSGKWETGNKYRLEVGTSLADRYYAILVREQYTKIDGLQIHVHPSGSSWGVNGITMDNGSNYSEVSHCIIRCTDEAGYSYGINGYGDYRKLYNNIVYDFTRTNSCGIALTASTPNTNYCYNCTVHNCAVGYYGIDNATIFKNCLAQNCSNGFESDGGLGTGSDYNCSDIASDAPGSNSQTGNVVFVDEDGDDFHLNSSDTVAKDKGTDLSGDSYLPFSDDIDGQTRSGTWDIGADEVITVGGIPPWMLSRTRAIQHLMVR